MKEAVEKVSKTKLDLAIEYAQKINPDRIEHHTRVVKIYQEIASQPQEDSMIVAYLHEALEEKKDIFNGIYTKFGSKIAIMVKAVTYNDTIPYPEYIKNVSRDPETFIIKLADYLDNIANLSNIEDRATQHRQRNKFKSVESLFIKTLNDPDFQVYLKDSVAVISQIKKHL